METHQKDIEEKDPFGQNDDGNDDEAEKSFLKALLAERALKNKSDVTKLTKPLMENAIDINDMQKTNVR